MNFKNAILNSTQKSRLQDNHIDTPVIQRKKSKNSSPNQQIIDNSSEANTYSVQAFLQSPSTGRIYKQQIDLNTNPSTSRLEQTDQEEMNNTPSTNKPTHQNDESIELEDIEHYEQQLKQTSKIGKPVLKRNMKKRKIK